MALSQASIVQQQHLLVQSFLEQNLQKESLLHQFSFFHPSHLLLYCDAYKGFEENKEGAIAVS